MHRYLSWNVGYMWTSLIQTLAGTNTHKKIIYPDIDDSVIYEAISTLHKNGESPVVCGTNTQLERYTQLIDNGLQYISVWEWESPKTVAAEKLADGTVDGYVWGNISSTNDIIRTLIQYIGSSDGIDRISSHFLLIHATETLVYADAGIQIDPTAEDLAEIAFLTLKNAIAYGLQPRLAFLSFSTHGSGGDTDADIVKIRRAKTLLEQQLTQTPLTQTPIPIEGEIQFDAAYVPEIGEKKYPNTALTQKANVYIFPDLNSANIAYKITEQLWGYQAIWPIIQWLKKPWNDLSRWCSSDDIIAMHHITKNQ